MGVDYDAKLVIGWYLDESNLRALVALAHPADDPADDDLYHENLGTGIKIGDWHLVLAGNAYAKDGEMYFLSAFDGDAILKFGILAGRARKIMNSGRALANKIGIDPTKPILVRAVPCIW
jgi:hypothetical protein